jgi:hypothetical protein
MPKIPRRTTIPTSVYFPPATYDKLLARSKQNYRSLTSEVLAAVEKALQEAETHEPVGARS